LIPEQHDGRVVGRPARGRGAQLGRRIGLQIDEPVRQSIAGGEFTQLPTLGGVAGADDPEPHSPPKRQPAPEEECAQHQIGEGRGRGRRRAQPLGRDRYDLTGIGNDAGGVGGLPGEHAKVTKEAAGPVQAGDPLLRRPDRFGHRDPPG